MEAAVEKTGSVIIKTGSEAAFSVHPTQCTAQTSRGFASSHGTPQWGGEAKTAKTDACRVSRMPEMIA